MDNDYKKIFGNNLRYYMMLRQKTRKDLENDLGIPYTSIRDYEKGLCLAKPDKLEKIANYLDVPVYKLTNDKETSKIMDNANNLENDKILSEAIIKLSKLNQEEIKYIIKTIDMISSDKQ